MPRRAKKNEVAFLNKTQTKELKNLLLEEQQKIINTQNEKDNSFYSLNKDDMPDPVDEASANIQASQELRFRNREIFYLKKIKKALERVDVGSYGVCEECEEPIGYNRQKARLTAEKCILCKEAGELTENMSVRRSSSMGKTISELGR